MAGETGEGGVPVELQSAVCLSVVDDPTKIIAHLPPMLCGDRYKIGSAGQSVTGEWMPEEYFFDGETVNPVYFAEYAAQATVAAATEGVPHNGMFHTLPIFRKINDFALGRPVRAGEMITLEADVKHRASVGTFMSNVRLLVGEEAVAAMTIRGISMPFPNDLIDLSREPSKIWRPVEGDGTDLRHLNQTLFNGRIPEDRRYLNVAENMTPRSVFGKYIVKKADTDGHFRDEIGRIYPGVRALAGMLNLARLHRAETAGLDEIPYPSSFNSVNFDGYMIPRDYIVLSAELIEPIDEQHETYQTRVFLDKEELSSAKINFAKAA